MGRPPALTEVAPAPNGWSLKRVVTNLLALALFTLACSRLEADALPNVRLGMAPRDVRDRFEPGGQGSWTTSVGGGAEDTAIEWKATDAAAKVHAARFEFHNGMLVAIRATTADAPPASEQIAATPTTVSVRRAATGPERGTELAVFARDCPAHKEEAQALARRVSR